MEKVTVVRGALGPRIDTRLLPTTTVTTSFSIELSGSDVIATPGAGVVLGPDEAAERLRDEIRPLLAAAGHLQRQPIELQDLTPEWIDTGDPKALVHRRNVGVASSEAFIIAGPTTTSDVEQRVQWATDDPSYAELLELLADVHVAGNPRVLAFAMVERVEMALGSGNREAALQALGINKGAIRTIVADQSRFDEDRHAQHPVGTRRPPIDAATREQVRTEAAGLVRAYEEAIFKTSLTT